MKFQFIREHAGCWPVPLMCQVLGVSHGGCYHWRDRPESKRALANRQLPGEIRRIEARHGSRYGSPRRHAALRAEGRGRVGRLRRANGIRAVAGRRFRPTTTIIRCRLP